MGLVRSLISCLIYRNGVRVSVLSSFEGLAMKKSSDLYIVLVLQFFTCAVSFFAAVIGFSSSPLHALIWFVAGFALLLGAINFCYEWGGLSQHVRSNINVICIIVWGVLVMFGFYLFSKKII